MGMTSGIALRRLAAWRQHFSFSAPSRALDFAFFGRRLVGFGPAVVEEFGEPGGGPPVGATGLNDSEQRLRDRIQTGFGDLLGEFFVTLQGVEERDMMDAQLSGRLPEREAVRHEPEKTA